RLQLCDARLDVCLSQARDLSNSPGWITPSPFVSISMNHLISFLFLIDLVGFMKASPSISEITPSPFESTAEKRRDSGERSEGNDCSEKMDRLSLHNYSS
ncbi:hypothetical protein PENTCL1PPCAC_19763, partial [Pristionchus entomophagus]